MLTLTSCMKPMLYKEWEVEVKYNLISGKDTLHFEDRDTIAWHNRYTPVTVMAADSSTIFVRFMDNEGKFPDFEKTYKTTYSQKNKITYIHMRPSLNSKLELIDFHRRVVREMYISHWSGDEVSLK